MIHQKHHGHLLPFADYLAGYFFGMFGPNGPLPLHLTEYVRDREKMENDKTFRAFADSLGMEASIVSALGLTTVTCLRR